MVTRGGIALEELDPQTLESRLVPGLFCAGEMLDVDGDTGGYNLQAANSTGRLAGLTAAREARPDRRHRDRRPRSGGQASGRADRRPAGGTTHAQAGPDHPKRRGAPRVRARWEAQGHDDPRRRPGTGELVIMCGSWPATATKLRRTRSGSRCGNR
ncbi:TPA: hypothetical protein DCY67_01840 [Candidatus Acetothermia bacterium]|nr:hypothetical protein [Candidatus Acetothermia bacterium]